MKQITLQIKVFILLILFILPCNAIAAEKPEIFVQLGHSDSVKTVAFSSDGKYLFSVGMDDNVIIWNVSSGREIKKISEKEGVGDVFISNDNTYMLLISGFGNAVLWNMQNWKEIKRFSGIDNEKIKGILENVKNGNIPKKGIELPGSIYRFARFTNNGQLLLFGFGGNYFTGDNIRPTKIVIESYNVIDQSKLSSISFPLPVKDEILFSALSLDGKILALGCGKLDNSIYIINTQTGKILRKLVGQKSPVENLIFSQDGKLLVSSGRNDRNDRVINIWDINSGKILKVFTADYATFSPEGRYLLVVSNENSFLWDILKQKKIKDIATGVGSFTRGSFSPDGKFIATGDSENNINLWDIQKGEKLKTLSGTSKDVRYVTFSKDDRKIFTLLRGIDKNSWNQLFVWDVSGNLMRWDNNWELLADKKFLRKKKIEDNVSILWFYDVMSDKKIEKVTPPDFLLYNQPAAVSPRLNKVVYAESSGIMKVIDIETLEELSLPQMKSSPNSIIFSSDGKYVITGDDSFIYLVDTHTGALIKKFEDNGLDKHLIYSNNDKHIISAGFSETIVKLWDLKNGQLVKKFDHDDGITAIALSSNNKFLASAGFYLKTIKIWNFETGSLILKLTGHTDTINSISFLHNNKYLITASNDGTTRLWDISTGKEIAQFISFTDGEWIVITPEGYYNSSLNGHTHLNIRMGNNVYGIDQFYDVFYRPDIVAAKLRGDDISSLITLTIDDAIKNPPPTVEFASVPSETDQSKVKVCYQAKSTGGGIGEVRLFHNGKLIESDGYYKEVAKTSDKMQLAQINSKTIYEDMRSVKIKGIGEISPIKSKVKGEQFEDCKEIDAIPGENEISLSAFNSSNTVQSYMQTAKFNSTIKPEEPHLYILSIGIDQYKDKSVNLKYALKDAKDIKEKLLFQSVTLYKSQNIHHEMFIDKDATKTNILNKINEISQKIKPSDSFILFVAGHGILLQNQYYMLTSEYDGNINENTMISSNEIVEISKKIKSLSQLFIFDTCHAGGVDYIVSGLYDARMSVLAKKMGLHIYASANDKQAAMDGYKGNGLFTYTLLDGLNNNKNTDKNKDNKISLTELGEYSKTTTTDISKKIGHAQTPLIINFGKDNPVYNLR